MAEAPDDLHNGGSGAVPPPPPTPARAASMPPAHAQADQTATIDH
jgi:hypothetical protein